MLIYLLFIIAIISLVAAVIYQRTFVVIAKRKREALRRNLAKEREATADIINLSRDTITAGMSEDEFLKRFIEYVVRFVKGTGGAILKLNDEGRFQGCAVAGIFPPLKQLSPQVSGQLLAHAKKHTDFIKNQVFDMTPSQVDSLCMDDGFAYFEAPQRPSWIPESFIKDAPVFLIAPIKLNTRTKALVIVSSGVEFDWHNLKPEDGKSLVRLSAIATLGLEVIRVFKERQDYEERLQSAREEGMIQVSTGIIHNIGNAITVAKLVVSDLQEKIPSKKDERPDQFISSELIPLFKQRLADGTLMDFLGSDPTGKECLPVLEELVRHLGANVDAASSLLKSLASKLNHISEIIELQQRFVGELGTENMTRLPEVVDASIKIFEESFNKRGVGIETDYAGEMPEVLVDPSMLIQVFINITKNAIEAMDSEEDTGKAHKLRIKVSTEDVDGRSCAVVYIADNGPGMSDDVKSRVFEFGFSTKRAHGGGYGLHTCMATVKKYGGNISIDSMVGQGTTFKISIPVNRSEQPKTDTQKIPIPPSARIGKGVPELAPGGASAPAA